MACRVNGSGTNFDRAADDLKHLTPVAMSGETLRRLVEDEGNGLPHEKWTPS